MGGPVEVIQPAVLPAASCESRVGGVHALWVAFVLTHTWLCSSAPRRHHLSLPSTSHLLPSTLCLVPAAMNRRRSAGTTLPTTLPITLPTLSGALLPHRHRRRAINAKPHPDECYTEDLGIMWPSPVENRLTVGHTNGASSTANAALDVSLRHIFLCSSPFTSY